MIWLLAAARAGISLDADPVVGSEVEIAVTDEFGDPRTGETVRVHHGPGLASERELAVGITDGRGRIRWTPSVPGVAELLVGTEPLRVRVTPREPPITSALMTALTALAGLVAALAGFVVPSWRGR